MPTRSSTTAGGLRGVSRGDGRLGSRPTARRPWRPSCSSASSPTAPGASRWPPSSQVAVARRFGVPRILLANQLSRQGGHRLGAGGAAPRSGLRLPGDRRFGGERRAARRRRPRPGDRPAAQADGRGRRAPASAPAAAPSRRRWRWARAVAGAAPHLALVGVEGFEGVLARPEPEDAEAPVAGVPRLPGRHLPAPAMGTGCSPRAR